MKIGDVIQRVSSLYSKGADTDETRLSRRHIYNKLLTVRATHTIQRLNQGRPFSEWDLQPLHCISMTEQKAIPCGASYECPFMKSASPIPSALTNDDTENVVVTNFNGQIIFSRTSFETYKYLMGNKYGYKKPFYFIHDNYLYLINSRMEKAHMHAIWRNPIEVWRMHLTNQEKSTCFDNNDVEFFTPEEMIEGIVRVAHDELVKDFVQMTEDITNDSKDSLLQGTR